MIYKITHHSEETTCTECGCPLYVGDKVHEVKEIPYCSKSCAEMDKADREAGTSLWVAA